MFFSDLPPFPFLSCPTTLTVIPPFFHLLPFIYIGLYKGPYPLAEHVHLESNLTLHVPGTQMVIRKCLVMEERLYPHPGLFSTLTSLLQTKTHFPPLRGKTKNRSHSTHYRYENISLCSPVLTHLIIILVQHYQQFPFSKCLFNPIIQQPQESGRLH